MARYKNWAAINALRGAFSDQLRWIATFAQDEATLDRLAAGWPELFSDIPTPVRVSYDLLYGRSGGLGDDFAQQAASFDFLDAARDAGLPVTLLERTEIPAELAEILCKDGRGSFECGEDVEFRGSPHTIVLLDYEDNEDLDSHWRHPTLVRVALVPGGSIIHRNMEDAAQDPDPITP